MSGKRELSAQSSTTEIDGSFKKRKMDITKVANQPTLQELALQEALKVVLKPSFQDSDFEALEPRLQRLLFSRMRSNLVHLQESTSFREKSTPLADAYLHTPAAKRKILAPCKEVYNIEGDDYFQEMRESGEWEEEGLTEADYYEQTENPQNAYRLQRDFHAMWRFSEDETDQSDSEEIPAAHHQIRWNSYFDVEQQNSELVFTDHEPPSHENRVSRQPVHMRGKGTLSDCISSQLLQYRLTTIWGMLPRTKRPCLDICWEICLEHINGGGRFFLYDEYGKAKCSFQGSQGSRRSQRSRMVRRSEQASKDALALLNFLCGTNIPHPDPKMGVLAGVCPTGNHYAMG